MPTQVLVPPLGQTVDTLTFIRWLKQEGEAVRQGEPLFEVETDKASLEVEAPASGILTGVTVQTGDEVSVLSAIASIEEAGQGASGKGQVAGRKSQDLTQVEEPVTLSPLHLVTVSPVTLSPVTVSPPRLFASPRARVLAAQENVPLAAVAPTGPEGAIVERDVRAYLQRSEVGSQRSEVGEPALSLSKGQRTEAGEAVITPVARRVAEEAGVDWRKLVGTGPGGRITREDVELALAKSQPELMAEQSPILRLRSGQASNLQSPIPNLQSLISTLPFTGIRSLIAERMTRSHTQTAPVTLTAEANATALVQLRQNLAADGVEASYNDLLLTILAKALREHPRLNASLEGDAIKLWQRIDIGLAVDTDRGLLAPVLRDVVGKGLAQIAAETKALAERARAGRCTPDELRGSTFTLTNLGMFGIDAFTPIINLPETAILGVGRIKTQPVWVGDHVEPRQMVWLSLTFDHRLVDGGPAARFLQRVVQLVERPHLLMA